MVHNNTMQMGSLDNMKLITETTEDIKYLKEEKDGKTNLFIEASFSNLTLKTETVEYTHAKLCKGK